MSNLAKLSKQAVQHEHDRQFDKALALYARIFEDAGGADEDVDVALYNRAGDVAMRVGDSATATRYYEHAIDAYAAGGLLNNAIAVCNKVLRYAPDHAATHYTLAVLHAKQGFKGDAKHHFIEYADRMHRAGRDDEALRALTEFAALCPPGDDVRDVLGQHLARGNRGTELTVKLQALLEGAAPSTGAAPEKGIAPASALDDRAADLVFLDVTSDTVSAAEEAAPAPTQVLGLEPTSFEDAPAVEPIALDAETFEPQSFESSPADAPLELESHVDLSAPLELEMPADAPIELEMMSAEPSLELELPTDEPLDLDMPAEAPMHLESLDTFGTVDFDDDDDLEAIEIADAPSLETALSDAMLADAPVDLPFVEPDLDFDDVAPAQPSSAAPTPASDARWSDALPGELPVLSLGGWLGSAGAVVIGGGEPPADIPVEPAPPAIEPPRAAESEHIDLGEWLREQEPAPTTRLSTDESTPTGDEAADFERMLGIFRAGVARNIEVGDADSHYDLGVAFREMGLIDEAISEFQKAVQSPNASLRAREALGQCFLDRGSPELAAATLERAVAERGAIGVDESRLLNVWYLLGDAHARLGRVAPARECFERVVANDIEFRDAITRLTQLTASSP